MYSVCSLIFVSVKFNFTTPASILEISTISLIMLSILAPLFCMIRMYSCCSSPVSSGSFNNSAKPRMPFIGVLISWLILARKADFNRSLSSACSFDLMSSRVNFLLSVISVLMPRKFVISPFSEKRGAILADSQYNSPFFFLL